MQKNGAPPDLLVPLARHAAELSNELDPLVEMPALVPCLPVDDADEDGSLAQANRHTREHVEEPAAEHDTRRAKACEQLVAQEKERVVAEVELREHKPTIEPSMRARVEVEERNAQVPHESSHNTIAD